RELVRFLPVDLVNDPAIIARNHALVSINGALSVDLVGQVVADQVGGRQYSGIGGHQGVVAGAAFSEGRRSLICLPAPGHTQSGAVPGSVPAFAPGVCVPTPRHQVDVVITEYGAAELAGKTNDARREAMIAIAHPDDRGALAAAVR